MLTQARFTTSIVIACKEEMAATTTTVKHVAANAFQLPGEHVSAFSFEAVTTNDKQKLKISLRAETKYFISQQKIKQRNRAAGSGKLYLVFGQMKTEG